MSHSNIIPYTPAAYYYRKALREAKNKAAAVEVGMHLVLELEKHKEWAREQGLVPPRWFVTPEQRAHQLAHHRAEVIPFSTTASSCATGGSHAPAHNPPEKIVPFANEPEASDATGAAPKSSPAGRGSRRRG